MRQAKEKQKLRKDGQPRQNPAQSPNSTPGNKRLADPRPGRSRGRPLSVVDSSNWPGRDATLTVDEATEQCNKAYGDTAAMMLKSYKLAPGARPTPDQAKQMATMCATAYRCALPTLKASNAQAYIACVAQGVALDVFTGRQGSQLLYAAQVCSGAAGQSHDQAEKRLPDRARSRRPLLHPPR